MLQYEDSPYSLLDIGTDANRRDIDNAYASQRRKIRGSAGQTLRDARDKLAAPDKRAVIDAQIFQEPKNLESEAALTDLLHSTTDDDVNWFQLIDRTEVICHDARNLLAILFGTHWVDTETTRLLSQKSPEESNNLEVRKGGVQPYNHRADQYLISAPSEAPRFALTLTLAAIGLAIFTFMSMQLLLYFEQTSLERSAITIEYPSSPTATHTGGESTVTTKADSPSVTPTPDVASTQTSIGINHTTPATSTENSTVSASTMLSATIETVTATPTGPPPTILPLPSNTPIPAPQATVAPTPPLLPSPTYTPPANPTVYANPSVELLNMRDGPGEDYQIIAQIRQDQQVEVLGRNLEGSWLYVDLGETQGWVAGWLVEISGDQTLVPVRSDGA